MLVDNATKYLAGGKATTSVLVIGIVLIAIGETILHNIHKKDKTTIIK